MSAARRTAALAVGCAVMLASLSSAHADDSTTSSSNTEDRKILAITMVVGGVVALGIGTALALRYDHAIGDCNSHGYNCAVEDSRVPIGLGLAMVGAGVAMVGGVIWLKIPSSSARVGMSPSGLGLSGVF